jgi:agmatine deiminase
MLQAGSVGLLGLGMNQFAALRAAEVVSQAESGGTAKSVNFAVGQDIKQPVAAWAMPDEAAKHKRTWMAFGAKKAIWDDLLPAVQEDLARIAKTIAEFEPVTMLVRPEDRKLAAKLCGEKVELVEVALDDLWIRDTGPVFVVDGKRLGAVDLNFNGWGKKQVHANDAKVARFVAEKAGATRLTTTLVAEGGGIEVDGAGTAIITECCIVNKNRNPGVTKEACEQELKKLLGLRRIIWLPGVRGKDITDGHTDFYARFAQPGAVVAGLEVDEESFDYKVTRQHRKLLEDAADAAGKKLNIVTIESPSRIRRKYETKEFAAGYINFYVVNGAVVAPEFGDKEADKRCKDVLEKLFPGRKVVQINIDAIAAGGGGIHCATRDRDSV